MHLWHIGGGSKEWSRSPNLFSGLDSHNIVNHFFISTSQESSSILVKHFITISSTLNPLFQHSCKSCKQSIIEGVDPHLFCYRTLYWALNPKLTRPSYSCTNPHQNMDFNFFVLISKIQNKISWFKFGSRPPSSKVLWTRK